MNNFDKMEDVQSSIETLSQSVDNTQPESGAAQPEDETGAAGEDETKESEAEAETGGMPDAAAAQAQLSEEDFYTVEKGDTLDSISIKIYGDASHVEAICKMNGLSDGNLIFIGQKLLLP